MGDVVEIYLYATCSSCRKAAALIEDCGASAIRRDLFKEPLSTDEIRALFAKTGLTPTGVLSTRSRPFADLRLADKELSDDEIVDLMGQYPALVKRPIVVKDGRTVVGFNRPALESLLSS